MKRLTLFAFLLLALLSISIPVAFAQTDAGSDATAAVASTGDVVKGAVQTAGSIWDGFKGGKYRESIAGAITLLVFLWRRFAPNFLLGKLSPWWTAFTAALIGLLGTLPEALAMPQFSLWSFLWSGLATSAEAIAFWELVGQHALPKLMGKPADPAAAAGG